VCNSLLGEEEHRIADIQIMFHIWYFFACALDSVLLVFHYWSAESTPCMCCNQERINVLLLFSLIVCLCRLLLQQCEELKACLRDMGRESRSTFFFLRKVTSPFFIILASSIMSLGKRRFILIVPHMLLLLISHLNHYHMQVLPH
jgi:hypothetical protein